MHAAVVCAACCSCAQSAFLPATSLVLLVSLCTVRQLKELVFLGVSIKGDGADPTVDIRSDGWPMTTNVLMNYTFTDVGPNCIVKVMKQNEVPLSACCCWLITCSQALLVFAATRR